MEERPIREYTTTLSHKITMEEDIQETTLTNVKKILWDESENAPLFVLEDNRIFKPTHQNVPDKGWLLIWEKVEEQWEDLDEA